MSILNRLFGKGPEENLTAEEWFKKGENETDPKEKIQCYTKAIELGQNDTLAYYKRGCAHYELGEYGRAISDFTKAIELYPNNVAAYCIRGATYFRLGEYEKADADLEKAEEISGTYK